MKCIGGQIKASSFPFCTLKVACRFQIWKKTFCQNSDMFGCSFIKKTLCLCIHFEFAKNPIILSLFKID